ncbi:DNA cytosine methyltransferase [Desulforhopalus singaporensis]|uniref:DNA (cytosine-5-)-methyltransferase n=1 Tax=Desulforhopalus singaporensis TaxID=91360 RepID=A0A1H0U5C2_9BACT|nr:DNA cytosine methyltransferase [Desulforhopalus singaporensis]SDP61359.1 DNA (cytosine-5)-methyltransferase 1 [Desulforhopalus singaporensis]
MSKPRVLDLFSGAGGLSEGFIQAGFHVVASVEKDKNAVETQRANHSFNSEGCKTEIIQEDLREPEKVISRLESIGINEVDVIIGGPPCQGFTRANRQTATKDNPLNSLFFYYADLVEHYQPKVFVMENVGDLERFAGGSVLKDIKVTFDEIGYYCDSKVLNAINFGVPQSRNRIFLIGVRKNSNLEIKFPEPFIEKDGGIKTTTVWDAISDLPVLSNGASVDELSYANTEPENSYQEVMRSKTNGRVSNNLVTRNSDLILQRYKHIPPGGNWRDIPDELMGNYKDKNRCHSWIYLRLKEDLPSVTITHFRKSMLIHPREHRGLSVREAARLQSFPDHFVFKGRIGSQQQQVANAVPPLLAKAVANQIMLILT